MLFNYQTFLAKDWKFGIALWAFHTGSFSDALKKVDSTGLKYIEPNNFTKTLPELNDSSLMQLSPDGIKKLKSLIEQRGLICKSLYVAGGNDVNSWKKQFEAAKLLGVEFITSEPPLSMWMPLIVSQECMGLKWLFMNIVRA
jgi:sugar phosphate isomerase/epimerase